mmetsp:Transcript_71504/g.180757  ORF Transcript_71504/g.180757 Transcript_71504/m.180757 type:complete len:251 (-) Transcript_71504:158-910(-)
MLRQRCPEVPSSAAIVAAPDLGRLPRHRRRGPPGPRAALPGPQALEPVLEREGDGCRLRETRARTEGCEFPHGLLQRLQEPWQRDRAEAGRAGPEHGDLGLDPLPARVRLRRAAHLRVPRSAAGAAALRHGAALAGGLRQPEEAGALGGVGPMWLPRAGRCPHRFLCSRGAHQAAHPEYHLVPGAHRRCRAGGRQLVSGAGLAQPLRQHELHQGLRRGPGRGFLRSSPALAGRPGPDEGGALLVGPGGTA